MIILELVIALLSLSPEPCLAGEFATPGDRYEGGPAACTGLPVDPTVLGVAHRDFRCGQRLLVKNVRNGRTTVVRVIDHGPYGALVGKKWRVKRSASDPGVWRGCLDMTPATRRALRHDGMEPVQVFPLP